MTEICLNLPEPPSVNEIYANVSRKGRVKTRTYKNWESECLWMIRQSKPGRVHGRYFVTLFLSEKTRKDVDNCLKATLDMLAKCGLTPDDKQCAGVCSAHSPDVEEGRCKIVIRQLSDDHFPYVCFADRADASLEGRAAV